ncbi:ComEC/Rec2 family competence protein [Candidatus Saccharibacteria bacterium TM7i]|nr:ComEC/Rec2 family competence protein [Candidatus Saccharibacteria bacterium TM7i]
MWRIHRKIQVEWRIACLCAGLLVGVALAPVLRVNTFWGLAAIIPICTLLLVGRFYASLPLLLLAMLAGLGYGSTAYGEGYDVYKPFIEHTVTLQGRVKEDPSVNSAGYKSLQLGSIQVRGSPYAGSVFTRMRTKVTVMRGDTVTVQGVAEAGFGSFSLNLKNASIVSVERQSMGDVGRVIRDWFAGHVRSFIDEPQASLGVGYLTGQKSALPDDFSEALKIAGLTHVVVASGYNLTVLVRLARKLFMRISKFSAAMAAVGMVLMFMTITGLSPSMTRAGIVSGLSILFWYYGRKVHPIVLLLFVATLTVLYQPSYLWGDLGWQLSFSAFFGVMIIGPLMQRYFYGEVSPGLIRQTLMETVAAHIATVPIIALQFGVVSNIAIVANLLVVPLVPLAMLLTFICGIWSVCGIGFSQLIIWPTNVLLEYMVAVVRYVAEIKWAQSALEFSGSVWLLYLAAVLLVCWWMKRATKLNLRTGDILNPYKTDAKVI